MAWTGEYSNGGGFTSAPGRHGHEVDDDCPVEAAVSAPEAAAPMEQALPKEAKPWLPLSHNLKFINVASQTDDPSSLLRFYKKCIWFRRQDEILRCGSQHIMMGQDDSDSPTGSRHKNKANQTPKGILAFVREYKSGKRLVLLNFSGRKVAVPLFQQGYFADAAGFQVVLSTHDDRPVAAKEAVLSKDRSASSEADPSILQGSSVTLSANEGMVIRVWSKRRFNE